MQAYHYELDDYHDLDKLIFEVRSPKILNGYFVRNLELLLIENLTISVIMDDLLLDKSEMTGEIAYCNYELKKIYNDKYKGLSNQINKHSGDIKHCTPLSLITNSYSYLDNANKFTYKMIIDIQINTSPDLSKLCILNEGETECVIDGVFSGCIVRRV